jgi:7-cyano-7-deazaguanine synthase
MLYQATSARDGRVVLVSGGVDSSVLLYRVHEASRADNTRIVPLFVDYAQRAARQEQRAAEWHARHLGLSLQVLHMARVGESFRHGEALKRHIPLPHRNLVVLSLALSYAEVARCASLAIGVIGDDVDGYASASVGFLSAFRQLAATLGSVHIETPLIELSKSGVVIEATRLGVDLSRTYSCMLGRDEPCGRCTQCQGREAALLDARRSLMW